MNKEKYIGEAALKDKPGKKLTLVIKDGSVTTPKIADENVTTEKVASEAITSDKLAEFAVTESKLENGAVVERVIDEGAVTASKIASGAVETDKIANENVTNEKLAEDSVTTSKIKNESVTTEKLAESSVETSKIQNGAVTNDKIANDSLTRDKLDPELRNTLDAATGLPEDLMETIQNVDKTLKDHQSQLDDKQSQIDDKQQQITANDDDISLLQTRSTQMEEAIKGISASGGASQASAVTYENTESGLNSITAQGAIDELANKKLNKKNIAQEFGDSKDKVVSQFALPFREINSPEWLRLILDAEDHFLFGIQLDGSIEWNKGIPAPIRTKLQEIINQCQKDNTNLTEALNIAKEELQASITALQESKVDKEEGKSLILDEVKECFRVIENEEFIHAVEDSEDRLLFGIYRDSGKPYFPLNEMYHVGQNEEFLWVILDAVNHPLLGIQQDGTCWAAKAQWLDDIKAIKEALSSIDETFKTFQPKEDGKGLINIEIADSFFYISNDEYIIAVVDAENRILAGIKYDGEPYFPNHEMYSVITNEEWLYSIIDSEGKILGGFRADDGHMFVGGIDISTFIANTTIDVADIKKRTAHLSVMDNDEYLSVETDSNGKVIGYTAPDGSHYLYKVKSETIPTEFGNIEDIDGRIEITTDANGKVLGYRNSDGERYEHKMKVGNLNVDNLDLGSNAQKDVLDFINSQPKVVNVRKWHLPSYGTVNIKQETFFLTANDGYSDKTGIYPIVINEDTQANAQKALTVLQFFVKSTLKDEGNGVYSKLDNSVGLDFYVPSKVTYVNEVPYVTSSLTKNEPDGTYSVNETSIKVTKITDSPTIGAWSVDKKTEHQCVVDIDFGHYLKGSFYIGVKYQGSSTLYNRKRNFRFTFYKDSGFSKKDKIKIGEMVRSSGFNLKANYSDQSRVKEFIMNRILMDIWEHRENYHNYPWNSEKEPYSGATGMIKGFPIRVNIGGNFYGLDIFGLKKDEKNYLLDGDASGMIVSGTKGNTNNWTAAKPEDWEDEMNDELTESNKQALTDFFSFINSENFTKENVPQRMSVIDWIDYFINLQVFLMRDNTCRNMMLYTGSDKKIFYPFFYDLDLSWNFDSISSNLDIMTNAFAADMSLWENFRSLYKDEITNRYAYLRGTVLNIDYINTIYQEILSAIPQEDINEEKRKWNAGNVSYMGTLINVLNKRFDWLDKEYFKV